MSDFTRVGALSLNRGEDGLHSAVIDVAGGFAYFGTETSPGIVVKVRLSDMTRVGTLTLNPEGLSVGNMQNIGKVQPASKLGVIGDKKSRAHELALEWWRMTGKSFGICDVCNVTVSKGEGYVCKGAYLMCEKCFDQSSHAEPMDQEDFRRYMMEHESH